MATSTSRDPAPVLLADRYELVSLIGRGGMADVHRARDRVLDREVAVKVLRETGAEESERARFIAEARILAGLSHSGLVILLDAGLEPEAREGRRAPGEQQLVEHDPVQPFVVMELVDGPSLAQTLTGGPLTPGQAASVALQLAEALAYVHGRGVVHRDIKPGNVLLGPGDRVRLADFGIARLLEDTARHTRTGQAIGTAAYLAPEQVTGRDITAAADIYSLGLVLLETLTGRREYPGPPTEAALARLHRRPDIPADLPPVWRSLLADMTHPEPGRRPDGGQVAARLSTAGAASHAVAVGASPGPAAPPGPTPPSPPSQTAPTATLLLPGTDAATRSAHAATEHPAGASAAGPVTPAPAIQAARAPGEVASRVGRRLRVGFGTLPTSHRIAAGVAALAVVVVLVAVAANVGGTSRQPVRPIPSDTPAQLRDPLQRLHDAVDGGNR